MKQKIRITVEVSQKQRRRTSLVASGIAPSKFGQRISGRVHKDRKAASDRGERKHKVPWA